MTERRLKLDSILRIGEVVEVDGRKVIVRVDKNKNVSDLLVDGDLVRNVSVNAFVEIRKGFQSLIGRVDGERLEEGRQIVSSLVQDVDRNQRFLEVSMAGYIGADEKFRGGLKELPLIGNEVFIVTKEKIETIHNLSSAGATVSFAQTERDGFRVSFPLDSLLNSHIAIFGNTGSGKSNTLAAMLAAFLQALRERNRPAFEKTVRVLLLDFNGEFSGSDCITRSKRVFNLKAEAGATRIPFRLDAFLDIEVLSILLDATEKTQKPFLRRAIRFRKRALEKKADGSAIDNPTTYVRSIIKRLVMRSLVVSDKTVAGLLLDHLCFVLCEDDELDAKVREELEWHGRGEGFKKRNGAFFNASPSEIETLVLHDLAESYEIPTDALMQVVHFIYLQLIGDILDSRAVNEHVAPVISRLLSRKDDIEAVFAIGDDSEFWSQNVCVVNLEHLGIEMKKAVPLLLAKHLYSAHKRERNKKALLFVIDEAHNILSRESVRESDSWRDYRLETFEELIKEGRKFGVFLTISSQRPADISPTITSQAHNYFIHRLVNQRDLEAIANAVSFIDRLSEKSIPTLPTGTCIFSGIASQMPLTLAVRQLPGAAQPRSETLRFEEIVPDQPH